MTSKHYKWQTRWRVDHGNLTHESGFVVVIETGPDGRRRARALNFAETIDALTPKHGVHNAPRMVDRLLREAEALHG